MKQHILEMEWERALSWKNIKIKLKLHMWMNMVMKYNHPNTLILMNQVRWFNVKGKSTQEPMNRLYRNNIKTKMVN